MREAASADTSDRHLGRAAGDQDHHAVPRVLGQTRSEMDPDLIEQLADAEHDSWTRWMQYLFSKCSHGSHGALIPLALVERWQRQAATPYAGLSESEKESDRNEVRKIVPLIEAAYATRTHEEARQR